MIPGHILITAGFMKSRIRVEFYREDSASQVGMAHRLPAVSEVESLKLDQSLLAILTWAGLGTEDRTLFATHFGYALEDLDKTHSPHARSSTEGYVPNRTFRPQGNNLQKGAISTAYQIAVGLCTVATEATEVVASKSQVSPTKKVKMSSLIDPLDDSEVPTAASGQIEEWYRNYKDIKFGHPLPDKEPTPDQLMAMHTSGRGAQAGTVRRLQHPHVTRETDGQARETDGQEPQAPKLDPTSRRYVPAGGGARPRVAHDVGGVLCGLGGHHAHAPLPARQGGRSAGAGSYPDCHRDVLGSFPTVVQKNTQSVGTCVRRRRIAAGPSISHVWRAFSRKNKGRQVTWSEVLICAAQDDRYWDREVRRPAIGFLARGTKRSFSDLEKNSPTVGGPRRRRGNRSKPFLQVNQDQKGNGKGKGKGGKKQHPIKNKQGLFVTTREGAQICFRFATRADRDACLTPCPQGRAHVCQRCLQPHRNNSEACTAKGAN